MTKIILIRHGETNWNLTGRYQGQTDIALSEKGLSQVKYVADRLYREAIDAVYSSDLDRAYQTAKGIAVKHKLSVKKDERFREINFGAWEGLTYDEIQAKWPNELKLFFSTTSQAEIPDGEKITMLAERVSAAIKQIVADNPDKTIAIVAHGMVIRAAIAHFLHLPLDYVWSLRQDNTAINVIGFYHGKAILELINDTCHLHGTMG